MTCGRRAENGILALRVEGEYWPVGEDGARELLAALADKLVGADYSCSDWAEDGGAWVAECSWEEAGRELALTLRVSVRR